MRNTPPTASSSDMLRFQWSVQALAQDARTQSALYPGFVCVPDELALEFDELLRRLKGSSLLTIFTSDQVRLIEELDCKLAAMSGSENEHLWTDEALESASEWNGVREAAHRLLESMGWSKAPPPVNRAIYVGPDA